MTEAVKPSVFDYIPGVRGMRERTAALHLEQALWVDRHERWQRDYVRWANIFNDRGNDSYSTRVSALASQLRKSGKGYNSVEIAAEERVSMERFCELGLVVPTIDVRTAELQVLGFRFAPNEMTFAFEQGGNVRFTKYPEGWCLKPSDPDRLGSNTRFATAYDEQGRERMSIFWSDSATGGKGLQARTQILPQQQ